MIGRTHLQLALMAILCAFICYIAKMIHLDAEDIIIKAPDITIYDIVYYNAESFMIMFSSYATYSLCNFINLSYPKVLLIYCIRQLAEFICVVLFIRVIFHMITYTQPYKFEYVVYLNVLVFFVISFFHTRKRLTNL